MSQPSDISSSGQRSGGAFFSEDRTKIAVQQGQESLLNRVPPHSEEAEIALLAALLTNYSEALRVFEIIKSQEDFYDPRNAAIFQAITALTEESKPVNVISTAEKLQELGLFDKAGRSEHMVEITGAIVSATHVEYYANLVRNKAIQRKLIQVCSEIICNSYLPQDDISGLLDISEQAIFSLAERLEQQNFQTTGQIIADLFQRMAIAAEKNDDLTGVTTGFAQLDRLTAGLQNSDLIIVAARPSMGKTAFALSLAVNAALSPAKTPVAVFSLEMSREQLVQRMLALRAHVDMSRLRQPHRLTDEDWNNLYVAANLLDTAPIYIDDTATLSTLELRSRVRRMKSRFDIGLIVVDYLQLMRSPRAKDSRELEISDISRTLKAIAKEIGIPVVALSQLNRKVEERAQGDKRPQLSDLRESGAIEQDADIIMFIYRDDVYKIKNPAERPEVGKAEIIIGKQRNGPTGTAELVFHSRYTSFENLNEDWMPGGASDQISSPQSD